MPDIATILRVPEPRTRRSIARDLDLLGVRPGDVLLVHASLSSLGWVCGGAVAVVEALLDAVGAQGTIVVPTQTPDNSDPSEWRAPPVPEHWWPIIREHMPAFDPAVTPSHGMGAVAEALRTWRGARRSDHPLVSFAARGLHADQIIDDHALEMSLGESSPLARLYDLDARVLFLGTAWESCTALHLAEYRAAGATPLCTGSAMLDAAGRRVWRTYADIQYDTSIFAELGEALTATGCVRAASVGSATSQLFSLRAAVDFAVPCIARRRATLRLLDETSSL